MKIAIVGYGKMGHEVEAMAKSEGIGIASIIDPKDKDAAFKKISAEAVKNADVAIDFSTPRRQQ